MRFASFSIFWGHGYLLQTFLLFHSLILGPKFPPFFHLHVFVKLHSSGERNNLKTIQYYSTKQENFHASVW